MASTLEWALGYVSQGWAIFPVAPGAKHPLTKNGVKDATKDKRIVETWWGVQWPDANIGIACGAVSDIVVVDIDERHGGLATMTSLQSEGKLPPTRTHETARQGFHFIYAHPGEAIRNRSGLLPGVDMKADGGYIVAPPSLYLDNETEALGAYKLKDDIAIAPLPAFFVEAGRRESAAAAEAFLSPSSNEDSFRGELRKPTLDFIARGAVPGTWHDRFFRAAMDLKQNSYPIDEAEELLSKATGYLDENDMAQLRDVYANRTCELPPNEPSPLDAEPVYSCVVKASELASKAVRRLSDKTLVKGEPTLLEGLDELLGGGKRLGEITLTHAEAKTGKNTLWHKLMFHWLEKGIPIGYASREISPEADVLPNLLSLKFKENAWLADMHEKRSQQYMDATRRWPLYFAGFNQGYGYFPLEEAKKWMLECKSLGVKYFWFDHLHYMLLNPDEHKDAVRFISELRPFVLQEQVHLDLIVQPVRLAEGQKLSLNTLKGGSHIGQTADNIFLMEIEDRNIRKITLHKARSKLAKPGSFYLQYNPDTTDFMEVEPVSDDTASAEPLTPYNQGKPRAWGANRTIDG